ncbi:MAG TPA: DUF1499 domain-containing protein, partial [Longimicrobiales bacterium]|nr:DUF1499 domain-containing protein [Longimicrobiales bacterium]
MPFARVWEAALEVADDMGWTVVHADELEGRLRAEARTTVFRFVDDVEVRLSLDADAQTRVAARSSSRVG